MENPRTFGSLIYARNKNMSYKKEGVLANSTMTVEQGIVDNGTGHVWIGAKGTFSKADCEAFNGKKKVEAIKPTKKKADGLMNKMKKKLKK